MGGKAQKMGTLKKTTKIFILHGWAYSTEKWIPFLTLLKKEGIDYELLKIPGLTAPLQSVWTISDYMAWLQEKLASYKSQSVLLGHSNGGRIAAAFTAKYPEKVKGLILIDSAGIVRKDAAAILKRSFFGQIAKAGRKIIAAGSIRNLFYKVIGEQDYNMADPKLKKTMINLISQDLSREFSQIKVPTLIIWGGEDKITPLSQGEKIHGLVKRSKFEIIDDAKHSPQFTKPDEVLNLISVFIKHHGNI